MLIIFALQSLLMSRVSKTRFVISASDDVVLYEKVGYEKKKLHRDLYAKIINNIVK